MDLSGCWPQLWSLICRPWSSMTARRVQTIGDRLPARTCWADLADSSQDCSRDDSHLVPPAPLVDDSYDTPAVGVNSKGGLSTMLSRAALKGPIDFTFLINDEGKNASQSSAGSTSPPPAESAASSSCGPTSSAEHGRLNPSATAFVPVTSSSSIPWGGACLRQQPSSPDASMPPPAVPQASTKSRRIRGKRALSSLQKDLPQAPAVKRPKEQGRSRLNSFEASTAPPQQRANLPSEPPPPATEEEWQHRIAKRIKVVTSMKETREYRGYTGLRSPDQRLDGEPRTPTAEDRSLSKRRWEYEIQQWRTQLKQWAVDNLPLEEADAMQLEEALSPSMEAED